MSTFYDLILAARRGNMHVLEEATDDQIQALNIRHETLLHGCARAGAPDGMVWYLAQVRHLNVNACTHRDRRPIEMAIDSGHINVLRELVAMGAKVNAKTRNGETLLMRAARRGDLAAMDVLVAGGADPNVVSYDGKTILTVAGAHGYAATARHAIEVLGYDPFRCTDNGNALHAAAAWNNMNAVRYLVRTCGLDVNFVYKDQTALGAACARGHAEMVRALIDEFGADLQPPVDEKNQPLNLACSHSRHSLAKHLICKRRVQPSATTLHIASLHSVELARFIVDNELVDWRTCPTSWFKTSLQHQLSTLRRASFDFGLYRQMLPEMRTRIRSVLILARAPRPAASVAATRLTCLPSHLLERLFDAIFSSYKHDVHPRDHPLVHSFGRGVCDVCTWRSHGNRCIRCTVCSFEICMSCAPWILQ